MSSTSFWNNSANLTRIGRVEINVFVSKKVGLGWALGRTFQKFNVSLLYPWLVSGINVLLEDTSFNCWFEVKLRLSSFFVNQSTLSSIYNVSLPQAAQSLSMMLPLLCLTNTVVNLSMWAAANLSRACSCQFWSRGFFLGHKKQVGNTITLFTQFESFFFLIWVFKLVKKYKRSGNRRGKTDTDKNN